MKKGITPKLKARPRLQG